MHGEPKWLDHQSDKRGIYEAVINQLRTYEHPHLMLFAHPLLEDVKLFLPDCALIDIWEKDFSTRHSMSRSLEKLPADHQKKIKIRSGDLIKHRYKDFGPYQVLFIDSTWREENFLFFLNRLFSRGSHDSPDQRHPSDLKKFSLVSEVVSQNQQQTTQLRIMEQVQSKALMRGWRVPIARGIGTYVSSYHGNTWMVCNEFVFTK